MALSAESLVQSHEQEFRRLRRAALFSRTHVILFSVVVLIGLFFILRAVLTFQGTEQSVTQARQELIATGLPWALNFSETQDSYRDWLSRHGTGIESGIFYRASEALFSSAAAFVTRINIEDGPGFFARTYLGIHSSVLRLTFFLLASLRLWIAAVIIALFWGGKRVKVYTERDILGQTGNGRVFFSGSRISLDNVTPSGAPADQVTGLACPASVGVAVARTSVLGKTLEKFGAVTTTNLSLIGILLKYKHPAYVARHDEGNALDQYFAGATLSDNAALLLEKVLTLHKIYSDQVHAGNEKVDSVTDLPSLGGPSVNEKVTSGQYIDLLGAALDRVLTPSFRASIGRLDAATIATMILSYEAGKVLAYSYEGGKWIRKSNFPQLSARAVLHSIPEFAVEYDFELRLIIRRAIVFASRFSLCGPVKFPVDMSDETRAARQWIELLMASPHELNSVADEVELVALISEIHAGFERTLMEGTLSLDPAIIEDVYSTPANILFVPISKVVRIMRRVATREILDRLEQLVSAVYQKQKMRGMKVSMELDPDDDSPTTIPSYERIFQPFTSQQVKELTEQHELSSDEVRDWSALRVVLNAHGWLGRRVWERSVPESSIVYSVFKVDPSIPGSNSLGFIGRVGMVPLRGTRLEERWGRVWQSKYIQVDSARIAETNKDYERLLRGEEDDVMSDDDSAVAQGAQ